MKFSMKCSLQGSCSVFMCKLASFQQHTSKRSYKVTQNTKWTQT